MGGRYMPKSSFITNTQSPNNITENYLSGYHRFCLEKPYHLDYVSPDLCRMLGYTAREIHILFDDKFSQMVSVRDRQAFLDSIDALASKEQTLTLQYHVICKDGHTLYVTETMTSHRLEDGKMYGFAVIADITNTPQKNSSYSSVDPAHLIGPHGFLQCTCEKYPKVTNINKQMQDYLAVSENDSDWLDFLKDNIFFMIPPDERNHFRDILDKACVSDTPTHVEHHILRSNGTQMTLSGWVSLIDNGKNGKEYAFIYITPEHTERATQILWNNSYLQALKNAYGLIFQINLEEQTIECIHGEDTSEIGTVYDINMTVQSAKKFWLNNYIIEEDREAMSAYIDQITAPYDSHHRKDFSVLQIKFHVDWIDHIVHYFLGVTVQVDDSTTLLCLRDITPKKDAPKETKEDIALTKIYSWINHFVIHNKSAYGIIFRETSKHTASLLFASNKICEYFSIDKEKYLYYIARDFPMDHCLKIFGISPNDYSELLQFGQLRRSVKIGDSSEEKKIFLTHASYKEKEDTLHSILIHDDVPVEAQALPEKGIFARTFGHFDLFVNQVPITFSSPKEKELMALLIDRNGGTLSTNEAISYLWENEAVTKQVSNRYRKLAMNLKNTLARYGIEHIIINNHGVRSIDVSAITCDYYELLAGNKAYINSFHNAYMSDYSWAEDTLATLWDYS
jgi:PAS domain S-box-containing protein